jgi:archaeosine synthase beta-subunit
MAERVRSFERVIVECHPALVGGSVIQFHDLLAGAGTAAKLEVAMGLEIADDALLAKLNKRMTLAMFQRAARFLLQHGIDVRAFVMVKPPFVRTEMEALAGALRSIDFAFDCGATVVSLIPARFGAAPLEDLARAGDFAPPSLEVVEEVLAQGLARARARGRVFVDLWDIEKLGGCRHCLPSRVARLRAMNFGQTARPRAQFGHAPTSQPAA